LVLNHFLTPEDNKAIVYELSTLATLEPRFGGKMFVSEVDARRITHRNAQDRKDLKSRRKIVFTPPRQGIEGNMSPNLATLREDIVSLLEISKSRDFALHRVFLKNIDFLIPVSQ
jgi:hypothetical protein